MYVLFDIPDKEGNFIQVQMISDFEKFENIPQLFKWLANIALQAQKH